MNKISILAIFALSISYSFAQQPSTKRPKITGIDHVDFYTTSPEANLELYARTLGLTSTTSLESRQTQCFVIGDQFIAEEAVDNSSIAYFG